MTEAFASGHDRGMQTSLLPDDAPDAASLAAAAAQRGTPGHFDEWRGVLTPAAPALAAVGERGSSVPSGSGATSVRPTLAPLWQAFFEATGRDGWLDMAARQVRVLRRVREDGATYNVYADGREAVRPWPLEMLPLLIGPQEWRRIEAGVQQRARLMDATLADVYGEQNLIREGLLPPSLIYGHPQYLRPMHGVKPIDGAWLHLIAVDLARGPDGHWWLVGHRIQAPSGLGYLLENRLIISQQFPEAFREMKVQRIAAAFRSLMEGLLRASPAGERSRVALLTPGPHNETYFEHVFLARYLGITLVEGSDLTVRGQRLYLKTLHGLERVHVLLRRVDDEWLDPLELRSDSALGVPGLLQAMRAGEVLVANAPGAGVLESPGLHAFWPGVAERLLGEKLLLPATTSWWCGEDSVWAAHRQRLQDYVIMPTFSAGTVTQGFEPVLASSLDREALRAWTARIDADPAAHTLLSPVRPSEQPIWREGHIDLRPVVLRVYAMADGGGGWRVLPGGLTRVAQRRGEPDGRLEGRSDPGEARSAGADAYLSMQRGSASTDTWVLTEGEVDRTSLLPRPLAPEELAGWHRVITSRSAENLFWLGRYTERAENSLRIARLALEALPTASEKVLEVLYGLALRHGLIDAGVPSPARPSAQAARLFERALIRALGDADGACSVAFNLRALRQCAQALRERLSTEHWSLIVELEQQFAAQLGSVMALEGHEPLSDVLLVLNRAATHLAAITGAQTDRMTRDDGWRLLSVGRQLERLGMLAHALAEGFEAGLPAHDDGFALLLGLFDSTITYRAHFQARREVPPLLHLLVLDTDNPRSLAWVSRTMRERLRKLARHDPPWAELVSALLPRPDHWSLAELTRLDEQGHAKRLIDSLRACEEATRRVSDEVSRHLFSHVRADEHSVWQ